MTSFWMLSFFPCAPDHAKLLGQGCKVYSQQPIPLSLPPFHLWVNSCPQSKFSHLPPLLLVVKNLPANARDIRDVRLIPGSGRFPGGGHGNPLQYCLENPMDGGAWEAAVHGVSKSRTWLKWQSTWTTSTPALEKRLPTTVHLSPEAFVHTSHPTGPPPPPCPSTY